MYNHYVHIITGGGGAEAAEPSGGKAKKGGTAVKVATPPPSPSWEVATSYSCSSPNFLHHAWER